jgi:hypothetical protein
MFLQGFDELTAQEQYILKIAGVLGSHFTQELIECMLPQAMKAYDITTAQVRREKKTKPYSLLLLLLLLLLVMPICTSTVHTYRVCTMHQFVKMYAYVCTSFTMCQVIKCAVYQ